MIKVADRFRDIHAYYFARKLAEIADLNQDGGQTVLNLGIGSPDLKPPEFVIQELTKSAQSSKVHGYQPYRGTFELRTSFASWYSRVFNVTLDPNHEVLPLMGSKEGIMHISMTYLDQGDEVLVPDPGYPAYAVCTKLAGGLPIYYQLNANHNWYPDFDSLEKSDLSKVKLMWVNYPNMPTGARGNEEVFDRLIAFGRKHEILICHDNPYACILTENPKSILSSDPKLEYCLELTSLSKSLNMAGWRVGSVVGHQDRINEILTFKSNMDSGMFYPIQKAASKALEMDKQWYNDLNSIYNKRKEIAFEIMDALGCTYQQNTSGLFVWGKLEDGKNSEVFTDQLLKDKRVFITPGHIFGNNGEGYIRLSLCSTKEVLSEALHRIKRDIK